MSYQYTSIAWTLSSPLLKKSASGKRAKSSALGLVALGTSTGVIVVWDLQKGEVAQTLSSEKDKDAHGAAVNDIAFNSQGNLLYSCSSEKNILEWNVKEGSVSRKFRAGNDGAHQIAVSSNDEVLAVGGTAIRTFDLTSGKKARKLVAGLSSNVNQLYFSKCTRFLFSSTVGGRFVNMYDLEETESDEPAVNFSMPSPPTSLFARTEAGKKKTTDVLLAAVSNSGSLFIWTQKYKSGSKSTKPVAPDAKSVVADSAASAGVLAAEENTETKNELIVVRGSVLKPVFERVSIVDEQNQLKDELSFSAISENLLLADSEKEKKKQKVAAEAAEKEQARVPTLAQRSGLAKGLDVVDASGFDDLETAEGEDDNDLTLAERVEALRERVESDLAAELVRVDASELVHQGEKPDASSLSSVLEQALQSKDNAMLEYCLRTRDAKTIGNTIKRVSSVKVLELLEILVMKFEKSPGRCARLCPWIRSILLHHTAYLMTQPDLVQNLSALYQILENRLKVHDQLQKLAGRLSLVIGQIHEAGGATDSEDGPVATTSSGDAPKAKIVYREGMGTA